MKPQDASLELLEVKNCTFRINRDIRFSNNKDPYKTHMGVWMNTNRGNNNGPGYYIHIEKGNCFFAGGMYSPENNDLRKIRKEISFFYEDLEAILDDEKFKKRIVIASTSEIYGKNPKQPLSEEDDRVIGTPQNIRWTYSDAKAIEEAMARSLFLEKQLPVTTVRFFNTVGPRQTGKYGMVVPRFVQAALKNDDLIVHGDGSQSRVFCHVEDAIAGLLSLLKHESSIGDVFNIGGEGEVTINDLANIVISKTSSKSSVKHIPYTDAYPVGFEDMQRRVPDTTKIRKLTGWAPKHNLESIIESVASSIN